LRFALMLSMSVLSVPLIALDQQIKSASSGWPKI